MRNWERYLKVLLPCLLLLPVTAAQAIRHPQRNKPHTLTGEFRTIRGFHSRHLSANRDIIIFLPPDYDRNRSRRYLTFYMQDGQNLFDSATSFIPGQEWRLDETATRLIRSGAIEPMIIVGIYNAGAARIEEYTPTRDPASNHGGQADSYGLMLVNELKPRIDREFRTQPDAAHTGIGGSSLGGLVSLYLALRHPTVFGKVAVMSPSVWWDECDIVGQVLEYTGKPRQKIWLDIGTNEDRSMLKGARMLRSALVAKGWRQERGLKYMEAQGAGHNEKAWSERVEPMLRFLYGRH